MNFPVCVLTEMKKNGTGAEELENYIHLCSGVDKNIKYDVCYNMETDAPSSRGTKESHAEQACRLMRT